MICRRCYSHHPLPPELLPTSNAQPQRAEKHRRHCQQLSPLKLRRSDVMTCGKGPAGLDPSAASPVSTSQALRSIGIGPYSVGTAGRGGGRERVGSVALPAAFIQQRPKCQSCLLTLVVPSPAALCTSSFPSRCLSFSTFALETPDSSLRMRETTQFSQDLNYVTLSRGCDEKWRGGRLVRC